MKTIWTDHLKTDEEKHEFRQMLLNSSIPRKVLEIVTKHLQSLDQLDEKEDFLGDFAARQAFRIGQRKAYRQIVELLTF